MAVFTGSCGVTTAGPFLFVNTAFCLTNRPGGVELKRWGNRLQQRNVLSNQTERDSVKNNGATEVESALWPIHFIRVHLSERDEPRDEVEASDLRAVSNPEAEIDLTKCLGLCGMPLSVCAVCQIANGKPKKPVIQKKAKSADNPDQASSLREAKFDACLTAPMARGRCADVILRLSGRVPLF